MAFTALSRRRSDGRCQMQNTEKTRTLSDRSMNRLIVGSILVLVIGILMVSAIYYLDRHVDASTPMVERQIATLEEAVRTTPNLVSVRLQLAGAYLAAQRYDDAVASFTEVLRVQKDNKDALIGLGDTLVLTGDVAGASTQYQAVVDLSKDGEFAATDSQLQRAYYELGSIALQQQRPADALPHLLAALRINHGDADTLNLLGSAFVQTGKAKEAVEALRAAVQYVPVGWCDPYSTLAQAYSALGRAAEAEWAGAMVAFCTKQPDEANQRLTALLNSEAATDAQLGLAFVAESKGDRSAAADWFGKVLVTDPSNFLAQNGLTRVGVADASQPHPSIPAASPVN